MTHITHTKVSALSHNIERSPLAGATASGGEIVEYIDVEFEAFQSPHTECQLLVCGELTSDHRELLSTVVGALHVEWEGLARRSGAGTNFDHITNQCRVLSAELSRKVVRTAREQKAEIFEGGLWGAWGLKDLHPQLEYPSSWKSEYDHFVNHYVSCLRSESGKLFAIDCSARRYVSPAGSCDALVFSHQDERVLESMLLSYYGGRSWDLHMFCRRD